MAKVIATTASYDHTYNTQTLHLPRLLAFHGGGTNPQIFKLQCRALTKALQTTFRFVYVRAPYTSQPGPDVRTHFADKAPFLAWLRWSYKDGAKMPMLDEAVDSTHRNIKAAMDLDDARGATGDWVGLLGFSQGAKLAASLLYTQQYCLTVLGRKPSPHLPEFRFAVLIAGRSPLIWLDAESKIPRGLIDAGTLSRAVPTDLEPVPRIERLLVPTLHVHGLKDPGLGLHREMLGGCCDEGSVEVMEWEGAHQVPLKSADVAALAQAIVALARRSGGLDML
ncbi:hypothetical protein LTR22_007464 [Elasticomyces elasticus]|nr:hypothetical protein LTR22_007464 [Elasticomyces elasticus]KAK4926188.1 hypothetical protein LTR49_006893 [Elasticomyces elasticus]KAK5750272.1 hypothetical protein LTS12_019689 [Elasticomyces elasticus]